MNIHAERHLASHRHRPFGRVAAWVGARLRARRARRMEEQTLVCLSTIEPKLLNDIGADMSSLNERNPHVVATNGAEPAEDSDRLRQW